MARKCSVHNCNDQHKGLGFCRLHLDRFRKTGDPLVVSRQKSRHGEPLRWLAENLAYSGNGCLIWPFARKDNGYANRNGQSPLRLMCEAAHGPSPSASHQVAHSCGKGHEGCISPRHLRWATPAENAHDKVLHGTLLVGEKHPNAKLTDEQVRYIRECGPEIKSAELALLYGCSADRIRFLRSKASSRQRKKTHKRPVAVFRLRAGAA